MIYAIVGDSFQQVGGPCPAGMIEMKDFRPEGDYVASETGEWIPRPPCPEAIRELRNQKLRETDWMVLPDAPITEDVKQQVLIYRQALRAIPNQAAFPTDVVWPTITW